MNLPSIKRICHSFQIPIKNLREKYRVLRQRVMSGHEPQLDAYRLLDRAVSTAIILHPGGYAVFLTKSHDSVIGAHIFELSSIFSRSFGITRRSGRHYTMKIGVAGVAHILNSLAPGRIPQTVRLDDPEHPFDDELARIAVFTDKTNARAWAFQSGAPITDHCGIGNARHISCYW